MRITRRGLFATIAAAFVAKPAVEALCLEKAALPLVSDPLIDPPNTLLTMQEVTFELLKVLENNTFVLPNFYRE